MSNQEISQLSDDDLLKEAKKLKSFSLENAFVIGLLLGVIIYSLLNNTFGFLMIIPLYFIHKLINSPKNKRLKAIEALLKQRNLK